MAERPEPPLAGDDTATMLGSLERQRAIFAWKCAGLGAAALDTTVGASTMTLGGLLLHLSLVEDLYFSARCGGANMHDLWPDEAFDDPDWECHTAAQRSPDELLEGWQAAVRRSRAGGAARLPGLSTRAVGTIAPGGRHQRVES